MKRIFIAIKIEAGKNLSRIISSLKSGLINERINWTNPDNLHLTLAFLGDTEENMIKVVGSMLKDRCGGSGKFLLTLSGTGVFKNLSDPRVLFTGVEPSEEMTKLYYSIIDGLNETGVQIEKRPFKPHLTLARIKFIRDRSALEKLIEKNNDADIQMVSVEEVVIYESILLPTGPLYKPVATVKL
jgi:2'-5' RNA ligase